MAALIAGFEVDFSWLPQAVMHERVLKVTTTYPFPCLEQRIFQHTDWNIDEVYQHLDAFELRVLAQPSPQVDVSNLQPTIESLRADIDMILESRVPESEAPSAEPAKNTVMAALLPLLRFHHLPFERMPRGVGVKRRMRLEHGIRCVVRWRLRGKPHLLMRRRIR